MAAKKTAIEVTRNLCITFRTILRESNVLFIPGSITNINLEDLINHFLVGKYRVSDK